jgi:hypothetical protein
MLSFNRAFAEIPSAESTARIEAGQGLISASTLLLELYAKEGLSSTSFLDAKYIAGLVFDALARAFREGPAGQPVLNHSPQVVETLGVLLHADISKLTKEGKQSYFRWIHDSCLRAPPTVRERFKLVAFNASVDLGEEIFYEALFDFEKGRWVKALSTIKSYESAMVVAVEHEEKLELVDKRAAYLFDSAYDNGSRRHQPTHGHLDFSLLFARCQGSQLLKSGDVLWDRAAGGDPGDLWGNALLAQDDYRLALSFVAEKDLELEGTVLTRLARLFVQVAKLPTVYGNPLCLFLLLTSDLERTSYICVQCSLVFSRSLEGLGTKRQQRQCRSIVTTCGPLSKRSGPRNGSQSSRNSNLS